MDYLDEKTIQKIIERIVSNYQPQKIFLFGSYAKGTPKKDSDIDLLIIKKSPLPRLQFIREIRKSLNDIVFPKDIIVLSEPEFEQYKNIKGSLAYEVTKSGRILYG